MLHSFRLASRSDRSRASRAMRTLDFGRGPAFSRRSLACPDRTISTNRSIVATAPASVGSSEVAAYIASFTGSVALPYWTAENPVLVGSATM